MESRTGRIGQRLWMKGQMDRHDFHKQNSRRGGDTKGTRSYTTVKHKSLTTPCEAVCL